MAMELPRIPSERNAYDSLINGTDSGKGTVFTGGFYHLEYSAYTPDQRTRKCEGVQLTIHPNFPGIECNYKTMTIPFKENIGLMDIVKGRIEIPFKIRLKDAIATMKATIVAFDDHNKKVKETAEKIVKCRQNIDTLISDITGGESVPASRMIEAPKPEALTEEIVEEAAVPFMSNVKTKPAGTLYVTPEIVVETEIERANRRYHINTAIDFAAQTKRADSALLDGIERIERVM